MTKCVWKSCRWEKFSQRLYWLYVYLCASLSLCAGLLLSDVFSRPDSELLLSSKLCKQIQGHRFSYVSVLTVLFIFTFHTDARACFVNFRYLMTETGWLFSTVSKAVSMLCWQTGESTRLSLCLWWIKMYVYRLVLSETQAVQHSIPDKRPDLWPFIWFSIRSVQGCSCHSEENDSASGGKLYMSVYERW